MISIAFSKTDFIKYINKPPIYNIFFPIMDN